MEKEERLLLRRQQEFETQQRLTFKERLRERCKERSVSKQLLETLGLLSAIVGATAIVIAAPPPVLVEPIAMRNTRTGRKDELPSGPGVKPLPDDFQASEFHVDQMNQAPYVDFFDERQPLVS